MMCFSVQTTVDNAEDPGSFTRDITYIKASTEQLEALTDASSYCSQEMAISCVQAMLSNLGEFGSRKPPLHYDIVVEINKCTLLVISKAHFITPCGMCDLASWGCKL